MVCWLTVKGTYRNHQLNHPPRSHAFNMHRWSCGSQRLFELLLRMDFVGIALLIWGSYVPGRSRRVVRVHGF